MVEHTPHVEDEPFNIYTFQQRAMPALLGWAIGCIAAGLVWLRSDNDWWQGFGSQFAGWGAINALIAAFGLRDAAAKQQQDDITDLDKPARTFETIVWVNAFLDVLYVIGGLSLVRGNPDDEHKQGMGWGIVVQGLGLFVWDLILGTLVRTKRD